MFVIVWQYDVRPDQVAAFERAYGSSGDWARLFARAAGYLGTRLLRDTEQPLRYVTLDLWATEAAFRAFETRFQAEYAALDATFERLTTAETRIGSLRSASVL